MSLVSTDYEKNVTSIKQERQDESLSHDGLFDYL